MALESVLQDLFKKTPKKQTINSLKKCSGFLHIKVIKKKRYITD